MITVDDLIVIPVSEEVMLASTNLAKHLLMEHKFDPLSSPPTNQGLRHQILEITINLLFRRVITGEQIPHTYSHPSSNAEAHRSSVMLGGRPCHINFHLIRHAHGRSMQKNIQTETFDIARKHPALDHESRESIEIFAGLVERENSGNLSPRELILRGEKVELIYLPFSRTGQYQSGSGGRLELFYDGEKNLRFDIVGLDENSQPQTESLTFLRPGRVISRQVFSRIDTICPNDLPEKGLTLTFCQAKNILLPVSVWENLRLHLVECVFFGFLHSSDLRLKIGTKLRTDTAFRIGWFRREKQALSVLELTSLPRLFDITKKLDKAKGEP